jgi:hypothetical protein
MQALCKSRAWLCWNMLRYWRMTTCSHVRQRRKTVAYASVRFASGEVRPSPRPPEQWIECADCLTLLRKHPNVACNL